MKLKCMITKSFTQCPMTATTFFLRIKKNRDSLCTLSKLKNRDWKQVMLQIWSSIFWRIIWWATVLIEWMNCMMLSLSKFTTLISRKLSLEYKMNYGVIIQIFHSNKYQKLFKMDNSKPVLITKPMFPWSIV